MHTHHHPCFSSRAFTISFATFHCTEPGTEPVLINCSSGLRTRAISRSGQQSQCKLISSSLSVALEPNENVAVLEPLLNSLDLVSSHPKFSILATILLLPKSFSGEGLCPLKNHHGDGGVAA